MNAVRSAVTPLWTFLLDSEGVCRAVVPTADRSGRPTVRTLTREVHDSVGAQFVGAVDPRVPGGVCARPRIGAPMLLAYVDADSRIRLLRTGPLVAFETNEGEAAREDRNPESSGPRSCVRPRHAVRTALRAIAT
jgi:hypothetical protein